MTRVVIASPDIVERLCRIECAAFGTTEPAWSAEDYAALDSPPRGAILTDDKVERGLLVLQFAADEAEILNLAVIPDARRQGLSRELLLDAIELGRSLSMVKMFLEVAKGNHPARNLYVSEGFAEVGIRRNYYSRTDGNREDAIIMSLGLGG